MPWQHSSHLPSFIAQDWEKSYIEHKKIDDSKECSCVATPPSEHRVCVSAWVLLQSLLYIPYCACQWLIFLCTSIQTMVYTGTFHILFSIWGAWRLVNEMDTTSVKTEEIFDLGTPTKHEALEKLDLGGSLNTWEMNCGVSLGWLADLEHHLWFAVMKSCLYK